MHSKKILHNDIHNDGNVMLENGTDKAILPDFDHALPADEDGYAKQSLVLKLRKMGRRKDYSYRHDIRSLGELLNSVQTESNPCESVAQIIKEMESESDDANPSLEDVIRIFTATLTTSESDLEVRNRLIELNATTIEQSSQLAHQEAKTKELEAKTKELEAKTKELEAKTKELEAKTKELEAKTKELEAKTKELEAKTKEQGERLARLEQMMAASGLSAPLEMGAAQLATTQNSNPTDRVVEEGGQQQLAKEREKATSSLSRGQEAAVDPALDATLQAIANQTHPHNTTVFIGGLRGVRVEDIAAEFSEFGNIAEIRNCTTATPPRDFAFVRYESKVAACKAINKMDGKSPFDGATQIHCWWAKEKIESARQAPGTGGNTNAGPTRGGRGYENYQRDARYGEPSRRREHGSGWSQHSRGHGSGWKSGR